MKLQVIVEDALSDYLIIHKIKSRGNDALVEELGCHSFTSQDKILN